MSGRLRVAIVHDWLTGMRGGEYLLEEILSWFKEPELFTLIKVPGSVSGAIDRVPTHTSWLERVPGGVSRYRYFLPVMPWAARALDVSAFDLVISSSHCVAKGVERGRDAVHVSYVHAPMRYMWDRFEDYFGDDRASLPARLVAQAIRGPLQRWDRNASRPERVDAILANSRFIGEQISEHYHRGATVVHPFVDLARFDAARVTQPKQNFYLMVGAFAPNKRVDLAVEAFSKLGLALKIVGSGQEEARLRAMAGPSVEFLGALSNTEIAELYFQAKAFVFPGVEDFGITPLESMAAGTPVIAYKKGGALDTVTEESGVFFEPQTAHALAAIVSDFERGAYRFDPLKVRAQAEKFSRERFRSAFLAEIRKAWATRGKPQVELEAGLRDFAKS